MGKSAIFLDIDGTITYKKPIPSKRVIDVLQRAKSEGHKIILNTGRGYGNIYQPMVEAVKPDGIISAMGQYIVLGNEVIRNVHFTKEMKELSLFLAQKKSFGGFIEGISKIYGVDFGTVDPWKVDLSKLLKAEDAPEEDMLKICYVGKADKETLEILKEHFTVYQHQVYFETAIKGYTKAEGMIYVADLLGISVADCIAVGDSPNDEEMIRAAGTGVAMGNAQDELKSIADFVTETNANHGVAVALEKLLGL